jgi:hypothetical protein
MSKDKIQIMKRSVQNKLAAKAATLTSVRAKGKKRRAPKKVSSWVVRHNYQRDVPRLTPPVDEFGSKIEQTVRQFPYARRETTRCTKHGRTTQICVQCGMIRCWKTACSGVVNATAPLLDRFVCVDCGAANSSSKLTEAHKVKANDALAFLAKQQKVMGELDLMSGGTKARTKNASAGHIRRMSDRIWELSHIRVFEGADAPLECITAYMMHRALVDKVKYDTLMTEIGVMNKWRAAMKALLGDEFKLLSEMETLSIKAMRDWAWDHCNHDNHQRDGVVIADTAAYIEEYRKSGRRRDKQFARWRR